MTSSCVSIYTDDLSKEEKDAKKKKLEDDLIFKNKIYHETIEKFCDYLFNEKQIIFISKLLKHPIIGVEIRKIAHFEWVEDVQNMYAIFWKQMYEVDRMTKNSADTKVIKEFVCKNIGIESVFETCLHLEEIMREITIDSFRLFG